MIVIDELGFVPFSQQGAQLLFGFLSQRCRRASLLITTNLPFSEWTQVFQDPRLLGALLDRLTHTCHILEFAGESYRFRQSQAKHARSRATAESPPKTRSGLRRELCRTVDKQAPSRLLIAGDGDG